MASQPDTPGQLIESLLDARGWDQRALAAVLGIDAAALNRIISGKRRVDAETAIVLSEAFDVEPERFLELQQAYDLAKARLVVPTDGGRVNRAALFGQLPITEMIHRGWLNVQSVRDVAKVEFELTRFFGVQSVADIEFLPHAAKKTDVAGPVTPAQLAWIHRVKRIAGEMIVPKYSPLAVRSVISKLKSLLLSAEEARKVPRLLSEAGIRFVIVESLKSAKIDGVCLWLDEDSPVVALSLRFDRIDNFWFVLRHELEHVLRLHGRSAVMLDVDMETNCPSDSEDERLANEAASEFCVPRAYLDALIVRKSPLFAERDILAFAKMVQVHPGIIAGQIQRRTERYDLLRKHLVKIRSIVSPGSIVDGWGDVAPVGS
jgi:HTH-type transcriptional regulator/antitoxin HigA